MDVARALGFSLPLACAIVLSACGYDNNGTSTGRENKASGACADSAIPGQYIVHWDDGSRSIERATDEKSLVAKASSRRQNKIRFVENDYRVRVQGNVSESDASSTARDWGQTRIKANEAWPMAKGAGIVVAVVDAGIDIQHAQLKNQLASNSGEIAGNGVDDDHNGFVDDVDGWDFYANSPSVQDPVDSSHHGSHVSGIILAEHTGGAGDVKGVAPQAKLLPLVFLNNKGEGSISDALDAMDYAVQRGAKIINASWGGEQCSKSLELAVAALEAKKVLFVSAAGNGYAGIGYNLDFRKSYPAAYGAPIQLSVGAMNDNNMMTGFSNYSRHLVHLMAPGFEIWSTIRGGYAAMNGTSMAAPFVSGAAAVVWSHRPNATVAQVKGALLSSVTPGDFPVVSGGYLNLSRALDEIARTVSP